MTGSGTRALASAIALAFCSGCCGGGGGDEGKGTVSLNNQTPYFVHFLNPAENALYVAPGDSVKVEVTSSQPFTILIAPGQEAKGLVEDHAGCCSDDGSENLKCANVAATWTDGELSASVVEPSCMSGDGSCPYVYSGSRGVLEGESLVGALNRGASRHDVMVLSRLAPEDGSYRVRIATELDEIDQIDAASLELWEHPADTRVVKGSTGTPRVVKALRAASRAIDATGRELGRVLDAEDGTYWEGRDRERKLDGKIRDWVELSFPRPAEAGHAMLIVRGRNTRLLQDAYHEYLASFGPGTGKLMRLMASQPGYQSRLDGYLEQSGFSLEVALEVDGGWKPADPIKPVGPAAEQTVAVPIELPARATDEVRVRLAMLPGAWLVDSAHLSFEAPSDVSVQRLDATEALRVPSVAGQPSTSALAAIASSDDSTQRLELGESLQLRFPAPPTGPPEGRQRTALLRVVGYYEENDRSPGRCVSWKRLFAASRQENAFAHHFLRRLSFRDVVDQHAERANIRSPR